jgi:hypothetical protein
MISPRKKIARAFGSDIFGRNAKLTLTVGAMIRNHDVFLATVRNRIVPNDGIAICVSETWWTLWAAWM